MLLVYIHLKHISCIRREFYLYVVLDITQLSILHHGLALFLLLKLIILSTITKSFIANHHQECETTLSLVFREKTPHLRIGQQFVYEELKLDFITSKFYAFPLSFTLKCKVVSRGLF